MEVALSRCHSRFAKKPNSKENTVVFSMFEAKDTKTNLKVGLTRYKEQVDTLQSMQWQ